MLPLGCLNNVRPTIARHMQYEYDNRFKELLEWQNRRIVLLTTSFSVVIGVLTIGQAIGDRIPWWAISLVLLLFLTASCRLTAYAGYVNQKMGAFFEIFHDPNSALKWELRSRAFSRLQTKGPSSPNLNRILWLFYFIQGLISVILPPMMFRGSLPHPLGQPTEHFHLQYLLVVLAGGLFWHGLWKLRGSQAAEQRQRLLHQWEEVRLAETSKAQFKLPGTESESKHSAEPCAAPNGGPVTQVDNSIAIEGPPSVS